jgi:arylsulfatase A-like enzyme
MIFSGYGVEAKDRKSSALTEFVDIYPTLCDMAGLPVQEHLQGSSLVPLLSYPDRSWKKAAFSQFLLGRFGPPETRQQERMGYTIRTDRYRYVEWYSWDKEMKAKGDLLDRELFDHASDPDENLNLAHDTSYTQTIAALSRQLNQGWKSALPEH